MDMWTWLMDCYADGSLTMEELEEVMEVDSAAENLWEDWTAESSEFIEYIRSEVWTFMNHVKKRESRK